MKKIVKKYLNNTINDYLKKDLSVYSIINELNKRSDNMIKTIEKNENDLAIISNLFLGLEDPDSNNIEKRIKYMFYFIKYCSTEINNLKWILTAKNKEKLNHMSYIVLYKLSNLRYKLSKENSILNF